MLKLPPIHEVADGLWVGPFPDTPELIRSLAERGIGGVVSLQTDSDIEGLGMSWPLIWRFLMASGLASVRVPIRDFDDKSLLQGLDRAVAAVADMDAAGHATYLHCTAGINRSPTVAIAWLVRHRGMSLDAAWDQVLARRRCAPHRQVLQTWIDAGQ